MEASYPDLAPDTLGAESFRVTCSQKNAQEKKTNLRSIFDKWNSTVVFAIFVLEDRASRYLCSKTGMRATEAKSRPYENAAKLGSCGTY